MKPLPFALDRELEIRAPRAAVFQFLTRSESFAGWLGAGSSIEARAGGKLAIVYPGGVAVEGEVLELIQGARLKFSYGYASGQPIGPGASFVAFTLADSRGGTSLALRHTFSDPEVRDQHRAGWRYQLAVLANQVCARSHSDLAAQADRFFGAWSETDPGRRNASLQTTVSDEFEFRDAHGCVRGRDELDAHIAAVQVHMPGQALARVGEPRQCQGFALIDWVAHGPGGVQLARGTNAAELAPDGRLTRVTGFWGAPPNAG